MSVPLFSLSRLLQEAFGKIQSFIAVGASSILTFLDVCVAAAVLIQLELF